MDESPNINNNTLAQEQDESSLLFSEDPKLAERLVFIDSNTSLGDIAPYTTFGWKKLIKRVSLLQSHSLLVIFKNTHRVIKFIKLLISYSPQACNVCT
jgi:hypothetical protein